MAQNGQNCNLLYYNYQLKYMCLQQCRKLYKSVVYAKERRFDEFLETRFFFHGNLFIMTCCGLRSFLVATVLVTFVVPGHFCAHCCAFSSFLCSLMLTGVVPGHFVLTGVVLGNFRGHSWLLL